MWRTLNGHSSTRSTPGTYDDVLGNFNHCLSKPAFFEDEVDPRFRALTLHQGLWQERRKAMDREYEYDVILSLVIQKIMDFENRKSFAK